MNTRSKYGRVETADAQRHPEETVSSPNVERARTGSHVTVVYETWRWLYKSVGDGAWRTDRLFVRRWSCRVHARAVRFEELLSYTACRARAVLQ